MVKNYPAFKKFAPLFFLLFGFTAFSQTLPPPFYSSYTFTVPAGVPSIAVEACSDQFCGGVLSVPVAP